MKSKATKKSEAFDRNYQWFHLDPREKLRRLDLRLGRGKGAKRQRQKIAEQIKAAQEASNTPASS